MAVVYVEELFEGRSGGDTLDRKRDYTRVFEVRTDDPQDDATVAGGDASLPRNGEPHPSDEFAVMVDIDATQHSADPTLWTVTCRYSAEIPATEQQKEALAYDENGVASETPGASTQSGGGVGQQITREEDPRDRPPRFSVSWEREMEIAREDVNGDAITNSANDPFDPPPMVERAYPVITISANLPMDSEFLSIPNQRTWQEATNSDNPWGEAAKTLRFTNISYSSEVENGIAYAAVSVSLKVKWNTWILSIVDAGFRDLDGETIGKDPVTGQPPTDPKPLDGSGVALDQADPVVFLHYDIYRPVAFIPILALLGVAA